MTDTLWLTVKGSFAHFQRPVSMTTKQTYRVPPRSAVAGLLAGGLGIGSDEYYDIFDPQRTQLGIEVLSDVSVTDMGVNFRQTQKSQTTSPNKGTPLPRGQYPEDFVDAQHTQVSIEYLRDPEYRFYIQSETSIIEELAENLSQENWHYQPYLGTSECHAEIKSYGMSQSTPVGSENECTVQSIVPDRTVEQIKTTDVHTDRFAINFEKDEKSRVPTGYYDSYYTKNTDESITVNPTDAVSDVNVGNQNTQTICFL